FVLLLPALNLVNAPVFLVTPYRADAAGVCAAAILAWVVIRIQRRWARTVLVGVLGMYYLGLTWWGTHQWADELTFYGKVQGYDPRFFVVRRNYALVLEGKNRYAEAGAAFERIFSDLLGPNDWQSADRVRVAIQARPLIEKEIKRNKAASISTSVWLANLYADMGQAM